MNNAETDGLPTNQVLEQMVFERINFSNVMTVNKLLLENAEVDVFNNRVDNLIISIHYCVFGEEVERYEKRIEYFYPKNCWQMFKNQFFPKWLIKIFPVVHGFHGKNIEFKKKAFYPKLSCPPRSESPRFMTFINEKEIHG